MTDNQDKVYSALIVDDDEINSETGADFYLSKPFDEGAFLSALQTTMPEVSFD